MADIFRGLLETRTWRRRVDGVVDQQTLVLYTPTEYTVGSSLEWPTPPYIEREQPQLVGVPLQYLPVYVAPPKSYTLMGQACL